MKSIANMIAVFLIVGILSGCTESLEESEAISDFIITEDDRAEFMTIIEEDALMGLIYNSDFIEFDVTEDGFLDLCVGITQGSGIVSDSIIVYDVHNHNVYKLEDRMTHDFWIDSVENDGIYIRCYKWEGQSNNKAILGVLKFEDDELKFIEIKN